VLLVACVNVAALLLLRAFAREREFAIRSALGASAARVARLAGLESAVLGVVATAFATLITWAGLTVIRHAAPETVPRTAELSFDWRVAALVAALGTISTSVSMSASFVRAVRGSSIESLRAGWQPTSGGHAGNRWRSALAAMQLAIALTLVAGAGLLIESFRRLNDVDLGFVPEHLASFVISPPTPKYASPEQAAALYARLQDAAASVSGVEGVAITNHGPLGGAGIATKFLVPGRTPAPDGSDAAVYKTVSASYLSVLKSRLVKGRWFTDTDIREAGTGVVVNEQLAKRAWPNEDPIGRPITIFRSSQARPGFGDPLPSVVIGVIANIRNWSIADDVGEEVYVPYTREVWPGVGLLIRTRGDPMRLERAIRRALLDVEPALPVLGSARWHTFEPIDANIARQLAPRRTVLRLVTAFAVAALALAAIGVYGVIAFGVAQRRREFGIRMAIGATSRDVVRLVLRQSVTLAAVGVMAGTAGGVAMARALRASLDSVLYRTSPFGAGPFAAAAALLGVIALTAAWIPARRAGRVDPTVALRSE
jgi:putative ABC transport system permease protein